MNDTLPMQTQWTCDEWKQNETEKRDEYTENETWGK